MILVVEVSAAFTQTDPGLLGDSSGSLWKALMKRTAGPIREYALLPTTPNGA